MPATVLCNLPPISVRPNLTQEEPGATLDGSLTCTQPRGELSQMGNVATGLLIETNFLEMYEILFSVFIPIFTSSDVM